MSTKDNIVVVSSVKPIVPKGNDGSRLIRDNTQSSVKYLFQYITQGKEHGKICVAQNNIRSEGRL
jgi:hypothetical protein